MKLFQWLLMCLAFAVFGAVLWQQFATDQGLVIVVLHGYQYKTTVIYALLGLILLAAVAWLAFLLLRLPFRLWQRRRRKQAVARMTGGLLALFEGRWARAEKLLAHAAEDHMFRLTARLGAAQAAQARGDSVAFDRHLQATSSDVADPAAVARAQSQMDAGRAADALSILDAAAQKSPPSPRALLLRTRALVALGRAGDAYGLLGALRNAQALSPAELAELEVDLATRSLRESEDANVLADRWDRLPAPLRSRGAVVSSYAQRAVEIGMEDAAANAIDQALRSQWDEDLVLQFGRIPSGRVAENRPDARLQVAGGWLRAHSDSPALAVTLGHLSAGLRQWGKAEDYLHRAIAQGAGARAWEELGDVYAALGDDANARQSYANALRSMRAEPVAPLAGRSLREQIFDASVIEERDQHGVPRLPTG